MSPEPEMIVLDTNVLSELARPRPRWRVTEWLRTSKATLAIPYTAVYEIERGILKLRSTDPNRAADLSLWLENLLSSKMQFLSMDAAVARVSAAITSVPALRDLWMPDVRSRNPKSREDLAIAALAITRGAAIATINVNDFVRINSYFPLPGVYDPVSANWIIPSKAIRTSSPQTHRPPQDASQLQS